MESLLLFLGRLHPLVVHLPIGILILLALLEMVAWFPRAPRLSDGVRTLILVVSAGSSLFAAVFGWWLAGDGGYDPDLLFQHRVVGVGTTVLAFLLLGVHALRWRKVYTVTWVVTIVALSIAGHLGGSLTHGEDYLALPKAPEPPITDLNRVVVFNHVVHPILEQKCFSCHGPSKSNGDLRYDTWEALVKGGKSGPSFIAGSAAQSRMMQRVHLPLEAKEHMPPKGKPQLTEQEVSVLEWWIDTGASKDLTLAQADVPAPLVEALAPRFPAIRPPVPEREASLAVAQELEKKLGIPIRPLSIDSPWFSLNARLLGAQFGDQQLAVLAPMALALQTLDLGETGVTDNGLRALGEMKNLRRLSLDRTAVTDAGLAHLASLKNLEYLNLHTTAVTDAGLAQLAPLSRLRSLYLWQTKVTPAAAEALGSKLVDQRKIRRIEDQISQLQNEIRAQQFNANMGTSSAPANRVEKPAANAPSTPTP